tara:strand:+ start:5880 stop:6857 length:978 start_codon:yes stop_codon:yes gene_type:complete
MIRANAAAAQQGNTADSQASDPDAPVVADAPASTADIHHIDPAAPAVPADTAADTPNMEAAVLEQLDVAAAEAEDYKQRWKSLDGQLRQRDNQLAQQADQIARLTELVSNMAEGAQAPADAQAPAGVLASDSEDFGDDMVEFVTRIATAVVERALSGVQTQVATLEHDVDNVTRSTATIVKKTFQEQLRELAPRYEEFDTQQAFHDWLAVSKTRHDGFYAAVGSRDAAGVADYFNLYASTLPAPAPRPEAAPTAAQRLESQVVPSKSSRGAPAAAESADPKIWTRTEIALNYKSRQNKQISDAAWADLEREMTAAQNEGRVDYDR